MEAYEVTETGLKKLFYAIIVQEAKRWLGTTERTGHNDGQTIRTFQRAVNPYPNKEAWCADFVQPIKV